MSSKQYTDEFKIEAVRQVTERGFKVAEVAERLGISTHSLYAWLRKFGKPSVVQRADLDQNAEIRRLKAELRRVTEERDIPKKPQRTLPRGKGEVRVHACACSGIPALCHVSGVQGEPCRLLRLAEIAAERTCQGRGTATGADQAPMAGQRERVRACDVPTEIFELVALVCFGGNARVQREAADLAGIALR